MDWHPLINSLFFALVLALIGFGVGVGIRLWWDHRKR
jgi:hypothetical protein